jgi:methyl-accepting chemotaxis protein
MEAMRIVMSGMWLQDPDSLSSGNSKLLMVFVGMVAVALMVQAIALIAMAVGAAKTRKRGLEIFEEIRAKVMPLMESSHSFVQETAPKVKIITENFVETSHVIRAKAQEFDMTASDLNSKTRAQVARVDGIVTSVLNTTADISETVQRGIKVPLREVSGLVNGLKAGLDVLVGRAKGFGSGRPSGRPDSDDGW